jgi:hypothetical protein
VASPLYRLHLRFLVRSVVRSARHRWKESVFSTAAAVSQHADGLAFHAR